jgi:hypothetical protein
MLCENDERAQLLSESLSDESRVVVECLNISLVSSVEKDRSWFRS